MKELKQNRKTQYTQMVLKDSLMELMREKPVFKITIKEICENADINRTTFYAYYADQYELLKSVEDSIIEWVKAMISEISETTDENGIKRILEKYLNI